MPEYGTCKGCNVPVIKPARYCGGDHCLTTGQGSLSRPVSAPWSTWRDRNEQEVFRRRLLAEYGGQCAAVGGLTTFVDLEQGSRCPVRDVSVGGTESLDAHHGKDGEPNLLLCNRHHAQIDPHARMRRK